MDKTIAKVLLEKEAVFLRPNEPFTWASGIKSPIYCDNRLLLSYVDARTTVVDAFVELIKKEYPKATCIMGTATAGISWAALIADKLQLPMGYVRSSSKDHGKQNQIEGRLEKGSNVVVVEDLISTGGSVLKAVDSLRAEEANVLGVVAIFSYLLKDAVAAFEKANCELHTLSNYDVLANLAVDMNYIEESDLAKLLLWKQDPHNGEWMNS